jgi:hypothetical protein
MDELRNKQNTLMKGRTGFMEKKTKLVKRLKKINVVNPEKNTAITMCYCNCSCYCSPGEHEHNKQGATYNNLMYAKG